MTRSGAPYRRVTNSDGVLALDAAQIQSILTVAGHLGESLDCGDYQKGIEASKSLLSFDRSSVAQAFLNDEHSNPLPMVDKLISALDSATWTFEPDLRYLLAQVLRLNTELTLWRSLQSQGSIAPHWQEEYIGRLEPLISHSRQQRLPGLQFSLQCSQQAILRWTIQHNFWSRYGKHLLELAVDSTEAISGGLRALKEGVRAIRDLRQKHSADWYDGVFLVSYLNGRAASDPLLFQEIQSFVQTSYKRRSSKRENKRLLCAVELLADLCWRGNLEIRSLALRGVEGNIGLIELALLKPKSGIFYATKTTTRKLQKVRYHACCHLIALQNHADSRISQEATDALRTLSWDTGNEDAQTFLKSLGPCDAYCWLSHL